ncbi:branched-chain amino acid ABC transporter permease [Natronomonas sp.]|uniref:branched-chain amino acid ABC transporter permease n=1 Tax=Natronomonas sp. TaxID=2184060 RepID=UPI002609AA10|nr:branched-chain amino acid ABC transporter permease [Natronomonas sp.]
MPCGEYFTSYDDRMGLIRWRTERVAFLLALPIPFLIPFVLGGGAVSMLTRIFVFVIAVLGLNVILGYAGEIVLAQGAFMAIGAYSSTRIVAELGAGLIPGMLVGGLLTATIAVIFGLPSWKVKGFYIAISTLALQFIALWFFQNSELAFIHGGSQQNVPREVGLIGDFATVSTATEQYFLILTVTVIFVLATLNLSRTGIARVFRGIHENDLSSAVLGINVFKNKLLAYAIGGFMIGVAGSLYSIYIGFVDPGSYTIELTLEHYVMLLLGGMGRVWGAIIGVAAVTIAQDEIRTLLREYAADATTLEPVFFGVLIIVVLAVEPKGIIAGLGQIKDYLRKWPYAY